MKKPDFFPALSGLQIKDSGLLKRNFLFLYLFFLSFLLFSQESAIEYNKQGEAALFRGEYSRAVESFNEALSINPQYKNALKGIAESYYYLDEYETALTYAEKAQYLGKEDKSIKNLIARIQIGSGDWKSAEQIYLEILAAEPNNQDARMGLAEVYILSNRYQEAIDEYKKNLVISPENRRSMISLILLYDSLLEYDLAEEYLNQAHFYHPEEELTYFTGMLHFIKTKKWDEALNESSRLLSLNPDYPEMNYYLGIIYFNLERYQLAQMYFEQSIQDKTSDRAADSWYMLGLSYFGQEKIDIASQQLIAALSLSPENEKYRLFLEFLFRNYSEQISRDNLDIIIDYYMNYGLEFKNNYMYEKALSAYRRALMFDSDSSEIWLKYADLLKLMGYPEKYIDKMNAFLAGNDEVDETLKTEVDLQSDVIERIFDDEWGVNQFSLIHDTFSFSCFMKRNEIETPLFDKALFALLHDELSRSPLIRFSDMDSSKNISFAEAYRKAQSDDSSFFILFSVNETDRSFALSADLYLSSTGALVSSRTFLKTGNDRIYRAVNDFTNSIISFVPRIGSIIKLDKNRAVINLGKWHGIRDEDEFYIIQQNKYSLTHQAPYYFFDGSYNLGKADLQYLGEEASVINITPSTPYNLINTNDSVILVVKDKEGQVLFEPENKEISPSRDIKNLLLKIR